MIDEIFRKAEDFMPMFNDIRFVLIYKGFDKLRSDIPKELFGSCIGMCLAERCHRFKTFPVHDTHHICYAIDQSIVSICCGLGYVLMQQDAVSCMIDQNHFFQMWK